MGELRYGVFACQACAAPHFSAFYRSPGPVIYEAMGSTVAEALACLGVVIANEYPN